MIGYQIKKVWKESWQNITRHRFLSIVSWLIAAVSLLFFSFLVILLLNVSHFSQQAKDSIQIQVFVDTAADEQRIQSMEQEIYALGNIDSVTLVSKDEGMAQLVEQYGSSFEMLEGDTNPLYDRLDVKVEDNSQIQATIRHIRQLPDVFQATYGDEAADTLLSGLRRVQWTGFAMLAFALLVTGLILFATLSMSIKARQEEIKTRILLGATRGYIYRPFFLQSVLLTGLGGLVAGAITLGGYHRLLTRWVTIPLGYQWLDFSTLLPLVIGANILLAIIIGGMSASLAIRSSIKYAN